MKNSILFNTSTNQVISRIYPDGYSEWLPDHIVQLEVIRQDRPEPSETQYVLPSAGREGNTYVYGWTIHDKPAEQILEEQAQAHADSVDTIARLEAEVAELRFKLANLADQKHLSALDDEVPTELPFNAGSWIDRGKTIVEAGVKYVVVQGHIMQDHFRPSILIPAGNRTLFAPAPVETENPCLDTPDWNADHYNDYTVGYRVKSDNAIWQAKNQTHTWIQPAKTDNGSISWDYIQPCP